MARAYCNDLRERVVASVTSGDSCRTVAKRYDVSVSSVVKWSQRYRESGSVSPGKIGGHRPFVLAPHRSFIAERMKQTPHMTISGLRRELGARGLKVSRNAIWRFLHHEGLSFKKKPARP